jgi:hypothetical protein
MGALPSIEMGKEKDSEKEKKKKKKREKSGCGCWGPIRMYMREGAREMKETKRWMDGWMDGSPCCWHQELTLAHSQTKSSREERGVSFASGRQQGRIIIKKGKSNRTGRTETPQQSVSLRLLPLRGRARER